MTDIIRIRLAPGRDKAVRQGHPWVFSGAVARSDGPEKAPIASLEAADGTFLGSGFYSPGARIRVRLARKEKGPLDRAFFKVRIEEALRLRQLVPADTTGYRLLNAEGDGLPGWTVDRFGDVLISQITSAGLEAMRDEAYGALMASVPELAILQSNELAARRRESLSLEDEPIRGEAPPEASFTESGLRFTAELAGGQKTGFYCDQRPNRRLAATLAPERTVLDLFAHSGAFSLYALRAGARRATAIESAARLIARGQEQVRANDIDPEGIEWVKANVFEELRRREAQYDLVICDPPPLVRRRSALDGGARAYKDLNRLALKRLAPGGFFLTFSCSAAVDARLFRQILFSAAQEAGIRLSLLTPLAAGTDHPVAITHPEGEYLKGWLAFRPG